MNFVKLAHESTDEVHFQQFKVHEKKEFSMTMDPRLSSTMADAVPLNQEVRREDPNGNQVKLLNFPRAWHYRELGMVDARKHANNRNGVAVHLDAVRVISS